jgi:hypothetical protein
MSLKNAIERLRYDSRMVDINLKNESISEKDIKKQLDSLPDLKGQSVALDLESTDSGADIADSLNGFAHN